MPALRAIRQSSWSHGCRRARLFVLGLGLGARTAAADVVLAPSADGHFGALLAAGPVPSRQTIDTTAMQPSDHARVAPGLGALAWSVADGGAGAFDLARVFGKTASRGLLGGELVLAAPFSGWLLLSVDGAITVRIDGRPVFVRDAPHVRGFAWDPVSLRLTPGTHTFVLDVRRQGHPWNAELRLLADANLEPAAGAMLRLPGTSDEDAARLAFALADVGVSSGLVPGGFQPRVRVDYPRGAPVAAISISIAALSHGKELSKPWTLGEPKPDPTVVPGKELLLPWLGSENETAVPDQLEVRIGSSERTVAIRFDSAAAKAVTRALSLRARLAGKASSALSDVETIAATLEARAGELAALEDRGDPSVRDRAKRLDAFVERVESGGDPLREHGVLELARRSRIDDAPDPLRLHVPASYGADPTRKYPLVVLLHGYTSTPERIMAAFLGTDSLAPQPKVDGFVLAPSAHGDAFYRGPGELEVLDALDWALKTYPIDPERVSIAGHSMGGTGATQIAFRYPDRFSAIGALAGYHSFFVRHDIQGRPLRSWELTELTRFSPASFAENGRDELLLVAQGTSDLPLAHSQSLTARYRALGYPFRETYPDIGHDVWRIVWANADMWPALSSRRAVSRPTHVTLKTDSLRFATRAWARITALGATPALLDASVSKDHVTVRTRGADAFELRPRAAGVAGPGTVEIDGQRFPVAERDPSSFHRAAGAWAPGPPPAAIGLSKRALLEGPIRDAWNGRMAFVYGTLDGRQTNAAREVAEHFRNRWSGSTRYPVLADTAAPRSLASTHSLFLVGNRDTNFFIKELDAALPLGIDGGGVRAGGTRLTGDTELGFIAVYPNPASPEHYVVVLEAVSAAGLWRAMSLPLALPDFIVFDS
ncbi:MAG TPA: alpha/beta hydrolase-fold protein, partial [Polyangiaceae bacterium]|nr:alpha/beta hydrolase-fold protein [Polyangiaceae bacterium]